MNVVTLSQPVLRWPTVMPTVSIVKPLSVFPRSIVSLMLCSLYTIPEKVPYKQCYIILLSSLLEVSFYHVYHSEFLVLTQRFLIDRFWGWRSQKSHEGFGMNSSGNLAALEKYHYISGMSPCLGQASASENCGRSGRDSGELSCKVRVPTTVLSNCHCCVSFLVEWFSLVSHHYPRFVSSNSALNFCMIWYYYNTNLIL
jgi:hypothetical protein